jgi:hypothetical protein
MKALANTLLIAASLAILSVIFGFNAWRIIAWLIGILAGAALFFVLLAAHRRLKKRWKPYWWVWSSITFPHYYLRAKRDVRIATDSGLIASANLIFSAPQTWFTMRIIRIIGKEINRRHKEMKRFERKHL